MAIAEESYAEIFRTDHLKTDLKRRSMRGGALTLSAQAFKLVLQFGSTAWLARRIDPSQFGLIGMVTAVTGFVAMFKDAGLSMATLQRAEINHRQVSSLFWVNVGLSAALMIVVAGLARPLASFYHEPRLVGITLILAGTFILSGLTVQHLALLRRQMRFGSLVVIDLVTSVVRVGTGVIMASMGYGYWALVGMAVAEAATNCLLVWLVSPWRPGKFEHGCGIRPMVSFGGFLTLSALFNYICENLPLVLIGRMLGPVAGPPSVGLFDRAYRLTLMPTAHMSSPLSSVALPAMCRVQDELVRYRNICRQMIVFACCLTVPVAVAGVLTAPELINIYLGEKWSRAAVLFACLSPLAATESTSVMSMWILTTTGHSKSCFQYSVCNAVLSGISIAIGLKFSLEAAAVSFALTGVLVRTPLLFWFVVRKTVVRWSDLFGGPKWFLIGGTMLTSIGLYLRYQVLGIGRPSLAWAIGAYTVIAIVWLPLMWHARIWHEIAKLRAESIRTPPNRLSDES